MTEIEAIRQRHSVRKYLNRVIEDEVRAKLLAKLQELNAAGHLHMQLVTDEPKAFAGSILAYGVFSGVKNYVMVVGKASDSLEHNAGYYGEKFVLYAQQLGLRTCWVGLTYKKISGAFSVDAGEKVVCCIALGYGANDGAQHKSKRPDQVSNADSTTPEWFAKGVDAALLAPTAINQQKFYFTYMPPATTGQKPKVKAERRKSLVGYTRIDLGIAMCNFEIGAGKGNFSWE